MVRVWSFVLVLAVVLAAVGTALTADEVENTYVGDNAKSCKMCHKAQVEAWLEWPMASGWDKLSDEEKLSEDCISCHVTGYGEPGGFVSEEETPGLVGIQCEACHGPAGLHMKAPITDKDARNATVSPPDEANCLKCHIEEGNPNFKEFVYKDEVAALADHFNEDKDEDKDEGEAAESE